MYPHCLPHRYATVLTGTHLSSKTPSPPPIWGNPHSASSSPAAMSTANRIAALRSRILTEMFNVPSHQLKQWDVIFTANATAAIKLVAESFPWRQSSRLGLLKDSNHTSVIGTAKIAESHGNKVDFVSYDTAHEWISQHDDPSNLFIYPAQCNFTGRRYKIGSRTSQCRVLVDAASYLSTSRYCLDDYDKAPDYIAVSFYKIFGFPTGIGALVAKQNAVAQLERRYFGGGTVAALSVSPLFSMLRNDGPSRFEDGTINFLALLGLEEAMNVHKQLYGSFDAVSAHVTALHRYLIASLQALEHRNGRPLIVLYGHDEGCSGPIASFNMLHADGSWIGHADVARLAGIRGIHLRTGGMCNPGALQMHLGLSGEDIQRNALAGHVCWDDQDILNGKPTGAIRVSLGAYSSIDDVVALLQFLEEYFLEEDLKHEAAPLPYSSTAVLSRMIIYPIKSCHGIEVTEWQVEPHGLRYDREWMIIEQSTRKGLSQKRYPRMCLIKSQVDLDRRVLIVSTPSTCIEIPLDEVGAGESTVVCNDPVLAMVYEEPVVVEFFSSLLGLQCTLARCKANRHAKEVYAEMQLSNESPFLLISAESVRDLEGRVDTWSHDIMPSFRSNFVISGAPAYQEDAWAVIRIGEQVFDLLGPCRRCNMVCIDQDTAVVYKEPFSTLSKCRRSRGRVWFGQHMRHDGNASTSPFRVRVGDTIEVLKYRAEMKSDGIVPCPPTPPKSPAGTV